MTPIGPPNSTTGRAAVYEAANGFPLCPFVLIEHELAFALGSDHRTVQAEGRALNFDHVSANLERLAIAPVEPPAEAVVQVAPFERGEHARCSVRSKHSPSGRESSHVAKRRRESQGYCLH